MRRVGLCLAVALLGLSSSSVVRAEPTTRQWTVEVVAVMPHDPEAFTQGLELHEGVLYESSGGFEKSFIQRADHRVSLPADWFAEGLTVTDRGVWLLTWRNHFASLRDRMTLAEIGRVGYEGEGWGLCLQDDRLVMSDGSDTLTFRDPVTFAVTGRVKVGVPKLNELECTADKIWANVWYEDVILGIDPRSGQVTDVVTVAGLPGERPGVLNGIAAIDSDFLITDFLITGKNWPNVYRVRLVPAMG